jgi:hypothetical protein
VTGSLFTLPDGSSFSIIKPLVGFRSAIERQLKRFPFEKNVFLMMRFRAANKTLSDFIIETLRDAGLKGVRADQPEWYLTNNVYNPIAVLYCCKYGIALLDKAEANQTYNPNVIYELGIMHCLERECLILKNDSLPPIPFDLLKDLYMPYEGRIAVRTNVRLWLQRIGLDRAESGSPTRTRGDSKLENAAVAAPIGKAKKTGASVVASPDEVTAARFAWRVSSQTKKKWSVSWSIKLMNKGERPTRVKVQVLFLDKKGFALEGHAGSPTQALLPGKPLLHKATVTMSPELAGRIRRAMATVSSMRK